MKNRRYLIIENAGYEHETTIFEGTYEQCLSEIPNRYDCYEVEELHVTIAKDLGNGHVSYEI